MIEELKPYSHYRAAQERWPGRLPSHWSLRPALAVFEPIHERNHGMKEKQVLSLSYGRIVIKPPERLRGLVPESFETYQVLHPGNLVLRTTDLQNDRTSLRVGFVRHQGIITSAYLALKTKDSLRPEYGYQLLNAWDISKAIYGYGSGLRQSLDFSHFKRMPIPFPPMEEQAAIVRFLDHANRRIDQFIRAKKKLIALLNEQKQAIIHRAVTRGLDPNVKLKDSGVPWLGEIPAHWEVWRINRLARVGNGSTPSRAKPSYWSGGAYPWLNSSQVNRGRIDCADQFVTQQALFECHLPRVAPGSVLVAITGQGKTRGLSALLEIEATINQHVAYVTLRSRSDCPTSGSYLQLALSAAYSTLRAESEGTGSTKGALTCEDLKRFKVVLPPRTEQADIQMVVRGETKAITSALQRVEREIGFAIEYRTRLIADVVTGQLDVRAAAASLPEIEPDTAPVEADADQEPDIDDDDEEP
ncbi:MAG: restriction endonuclease subunit S [Polyangiaceae bacterium]|nr:restriction endonuclease subunit S [Polyangiaceae bacterium]